VDTSSSGLLRNSCGAIEPAILKIVCPSHRLLRSNHFHHRYQYQQNVPDSLLSDDLHISPLPLTQNHRDELDAAVLANVGGILGLRLRFDVHLDPPKYDCTRQQLAQTRKHEG